MAKAQERPPALSDIQQRRETPLPGFLGTASGGMAEGESPAVPRVPRPRCRGGAGARGGPAPGRPSPAPSVPPAGPGADGRHPPGSAAQPPGQRIRPRCHLLAGALLPHPAAAPVPPGPGRFPGRHRAAGHGNHPAAAGPALRARLRRLSLRADADHDLLRRLVPHGRCLRVRVAPHRPRGASPAPGSAAGAEPLPGARLAGDSLHPGLAGAGADAPGAADRPRHLRRRHRARGALGRPWLQRHLQPLLLQLPPPDPPEPGHLLPVRRGEERGAGGENHLPAVPAAGARLLLAPVPAGAAPVPGQRGAAAAEPGQGRRLRRPERPQRQQSLPVLPAGFPALLDASLPPHHPLLHQHQSCLALCPLRVHSFSHGFWVGISFLGSSRDVLYRPHQEESLPCPVPPCPGCPCRDKEP
ncbi:translation initiation factor IF-2-like isoform X5 [Corvus cornix cornix]|uniref:translation initiation factor IF-2-like isoform X5 n=1 Tax=Corvus cornix cornix TaxID=932674 RepID=UPI00194EE8C0|nr:translation initiation factor IF-2-like isoform X5 [Corvus cornix cornix]